MIQIPHILCPIDGCDPSQHALEYAASLARWYGSSLTALFIFQDAPGIDIIPPLTLDPAHRLVLRSGLRSQLLRAVERQVGLVSRGAPRVDLVHHDAADAATGILDEATRSKPGLIVMGTHGRSGVERFLLGSVAEKVLRKARCPVTIVPPRVTAVAPGDARFDSVLCAVDFSDSALSALPYAISLAEEADAALTVLHVVEIPPEVRDGSARTVLDLQRLKTKVEAAVTARLERLIPSDVRPYCRVETAVAEGKAHQEILRVAAERESDIIVMGLHGQGMVDRLLFGSNTHQVVRAATCPVLAVPAH